MNMIKITQVYENVLEFTINKTSYSTGNSMKAIHKLFDSKGITHVNDPGRGKNVPLSKWIFQTIVERASLRKMNNDE